MPTYTINLSRIYENLPNQEWNKDARFGEHHLSSSSLHQKCIKSLAFKVWSSVGKNAREAGNQWEAGWANLNFFISGSRGSGKSTFLRHIAKVLTVPGNPLASEYYRAYGARIPSIHNLFFCDPTAMTSHENFFVSIIGAFKEWLQNSQQIQSERTHFYLGKGAHEHHNNSNGAHTHEFFMSTAGSTSQTLLESINSLAEGVGLLDEKFAASQERLDAYSQLQSGIKNSNKAFSLKRQFDELVNRIAESYHIDAFLVSIDDADLWCADNKKIIESIRTYLTHPRIIIFFTGDPVLTHETIKEKQFGQFDHDYHLADATNQTRRWDLINDMTAQYLKKVFPSPNHVALLPLCETAMEEDAPTYSVSFQSNSTTPDGDEIRRRLEAMSIFELLHLVFKDTLATLDTDIDILSTAFLRLPLRNIMLTLRYWNDEGFFDLLMPVGKDKLALNAEGKRRMPGILADSFRVANLNELFSYGFSRKDMELNTNFQLCRALLRHCINCKNLSYGYHLATSATSFACQESMLMLTAKFKDTVKSFQNALAYMLFGPFTVQAYRHYQQNFLIHESKPDIASYDQDKTFLYSQYIQKQFIDYLFFNNSHNPNRWARKISLIFISNQEKASANIDKGVLLLTRKADVDVISATLATLANALSDDAKESIPEEQQALLFRAYLMLLILCGQTSHSQNVYYLSVYNILGFIVRCGDYTTPHPYDEAEGSQLQRYIESVVEKFIQSNIPPTWARNFSELNSNFNIVRSTPNGRRWRQHAAALAHEIKAWSQQFTCDCFYAPDLGRIADSIFMGFCDTSNAISAELYENPDIKKKDPCILNAIFTILKAHLPSDEDSFDESEGIITWLRSFPLLKNLGQLVGVIEKKCLNNDIKNQQFKEFEKELSTCEKKQDELTRELQSLHEKSLHSFAASRIETERGSRLRELFTTDASSDFFHGCRQLGIALESISQNLAALNEKQQQLDKEWEKVKEIEKLVSKRSSAHRMKELTSFPANAQSILATCKTNIKNNLKEYLRRAYSQKENEYQNELTQVAEQKTLTTSALGAWGAATSSLESNNSALLFCLQLTDFYSEYEKHSNAEYKLYQRFKHWLLDIENNSKLGMLLTHLDRPEKTPSNYFKQFRAKNPLLTGAWNAYKETPAPQTFETGKKLIADYIDKVPSHLENLVERIRARKKQLKADKAAELKSVLPLIDADLKELFRLEECLSKRKKASTSEGDGFGRHSFAIFYSLSRNFQKAYLRYSELRREIEEF